MSMFIMFLGCLVLALLHLFGGDLVVSSIFFLGVIIINVSHQILKALGEIRDANTTRDN